MHYVHVPIRLVSLAIPLNLRTVCQSLFVYLVALVLGTNERLKII